MVIACPHALGLAVPLVVAINTSLAARNGMLVRDRVAMERARELDTIVFDKTGTLTEGEQGVADVAVVEGVEEGEALAAFALADAIREESRRAVDTLRGLGVEVAMLTGDSEDVARAVAGELGIDTHFAEVLPEQKDEKIAALRERGQLVAMVGDGVNDAPALIRADVGVAIGSGTDVAVRSADIVLVRNNPLDVVRLVELSRASYRKMQENLVWAAGYNVFAIPLAAGVLAPFGVLLSPAADALLMSLSTVIVAINAQLLRRIDLGSGADLDAPAGAAGPREPRPTD